MGVYGTRANSLFSVTVLTNLGEKMSDDEVDELLKAVDTSSGEINYTDLVRTILAN
jgi:Ca2+-binding EF-hand superfamily protein